MSKQGNLLFFAHLSFTHAHLIKKKKEYVKTENIFSSTHLSFTHVLLFVINKNRRVRKEREHGLLRTSVLYTRTSLSYKNRKEGALKKEST